MTEPVDNVRVTMMMSDLRNAPSYALAPDLRIHWYVPGDEEAWLAIHRLADQYNAITPQLFTREFSSPTLRLTERQCYLLDCTDRAIATATAWAERQGRFAGFGRLHWVAVLPEFHNRGIGKMIISIACRRLFALGHTQAFLTTSTLRPAAIHVYEKFGFRIANDQRSCAVASQGD